MLQATARDSSWGFFFPGGASGGASGDASGGGGGGGGNAVPVRALLLTCALVQLILFTGLINYLAPLVTALFLLAFCLINLVSQTPDWTIQLLM